MTLFQITPSPSATETAWPKKGSLLKTSSDMSRRNLKAGAGKSGRSTATGKSGREKFVFSFGAGKADGDENRKDLLGGKGANLHGMTRLGLPVPPGFTISTDVCSYFYLNHKTYPKVLEPQVKLALSRIEKQMH